MTTLEEEHAGLTLHPVVVEKWCCNGCVNPLIRNLEHLREVAGLDIDEALRWMRIETKCPDSASAEDTFRAWICARKSGWRFRQDLAPGCKTIAQLVAKFGGIDSKARCADLWDLIRCFGLIGSYNDFDAAKAALCFQDHNRWAFYNPNNPNNCRDAYGYYIAWEGSHAVYVTYLTGPRYVLTPDRKHYYSWEDLDFQRDCGALAKATGRG